MGSNQPSRHVVQVSFPHLQDGRQCRHKISLSTFFQNKDGNIMRNDLAYPGFEEPEDTGEQKLCVELGG